MAGPLRVGVVGLSAKGSWAAGAHLAALRALGGDFELAGVANSSLESSRQAAETFGIPRAFASVDELAASPDIDIVLVSVKIPQHFPVVKAALAARKHVFCEWALGKNLEEAKELAELARQQGVVAVIGTQAVVAPEVQHLQELAKGGFFGEVLSVTVLGSGLAWGPQVDQRNTYLLDKANGATVLTIPFGHTLAAVQAVLGEVVEVSARLVARRTTATVAGTSEVKPMTSEDQVLVQGLLANGAPISIQYRGGLPRGTGLLWEINGTAGDAQVTAPNGHAQLAPLTLRAAKGEEPELAQLELPEELRQGFPQEPVSGNVARLWARMAADIRGGTKTAPSFDDALALHRLIAAVQLAAETGRRVAVKDL